ncbi:MULTISPECIES: VapE domain-containing protein [unclassified Ruegeria]|uniref:VapE domain-containing protein n=1 Tax=unclassified Ruegeria TaxID=2625375 RepID=UPI001492CC5B|nr:MULTISPECIES: VapE domain-containing protein [unclassified Ruegeria]NOD87411.1 hypothetical protein [Ruegeria sp. HKCCD4318]NOE12966.1 hypothetical protein [Ruegeria sp. HKCCD4318-2]NOG08867.1 hypothetical protein [Ruegeria sp. HKCCD4315]
MTKLQQQTVYGNHQLWLRNGFDQIIPVIPQGAVLHEHSKVDPGARGKCPGEFYGGAWDGMGSWPNFYMDAIKAVRYDELCANVGLKMGEVWCALDVDITDDVTAQAMLQRVHDLGRGSYFIRWGQIPKFLVLFKIAPGETIRRRQYPIKKDGVTQKVEVMGITATGRATQAVVAGTHPSGAQYQWNMQPVADAIQEATTDQMDYLVEQMILVAESRGWTRGRATSPSGSNDGLSNLGAEPFDPSLVGPIVDLIPNVDVEYDEWISIAYAIKNALGGGGWEIFEAWSAKAPKNVPAYTKRTWDTFKADNMSGFGKLVYWARHACGGELPGELDAKVKTGYRMQQATKAGMPLLAPDVPTQGAITIATPDPSSPIVEDPSGRFPFAHDKNGNMIPNYANVIATLMTNDIWRGKLGFDLFNGRRCFTGDIPFLKVKAGDLLEDHHFGGFHQWFQFGLFAKIGRNDVINAVEAACMENAFDPLQDYLTGLKWDGVPRINSWLWTYCGVTMADPIYLTYLSVAGRKWLIAAVARGMIPGCKVDNALIFEGPQGVGKSSALAALVPDPDWFGDSLPDFHHKDAKSYLNGKWIVELAELTQVHKGELENMRSFMSRTKEDYRPSHARLEIKRPRRCVFAGSTNRDDYLKDPAGERRFWIVQTDGHFDIEGLTAVRDQLWAEAYEAYKSGEVWYMDRATANMARSIQQERVARDPWADTLANLLATRDETSLPECFALMNIPEKERTPAQQNRIKTALKSIGFERNGLISHNREGNKGRARFSRRTG